jgi:methanogenic corrinoid protein MtbC1
VIDLGVDVPVEKFIESIINEKPNMLCMSALLTSTMEEMKNVINVLKENNLRDKIKVIVGGRPVTKDFAIEIGADGYAEDAVKAVKVIKELIGIKEG